MKQLTFYFQWKPIRYASKGVFPFWLLLTTIVGAPLSSIELNRFDPKNLVSIPVPLLFCWFARENHLKKRITGIFSPDCAALKLGQFYRVFHNVYEKSGTLFTVNSKRCTVSRQRTGGKIWMALRAMAYAIASSTFASTIASTMARTIKSHHSSAGTTVFTIASTNASTFVSDINSPVVLQILHLVFLYTPV